MQRVNSLTSAIEDKIGIQEETGNVIIVIPKDSELTELVDLFINIGNKLIIGSMWSLDMFWISKYFLSISKELSLSRFKKLPKQKGQAVKQQPAGFFCFLF